MNLVSLSDSLAMTKNATVCSKEFEVAPLQSYPY